MMTRLFRIALAVAPLGAVAMTAAPATAGPHHKKPVVKKTLDEAKAIALAEVPGTIKGTELEREHGRWIYSIEIRPTGDQDRRHIKEVNVDANDGTIVTIEDERDGH